MARISIKINLRQLKSAVREMKAQNGMVKCLIIPIEENSLYEGERGVYLELMGFEIKEKKDDRKNTHIIKQSLRKEVYEKMSEAQRKEMPIIGNAILWGSWEPEPQNFDVGEREQPDQFGDDPDDLPF